MTKQDKEQTAEEYLEKRTYLCYCGNLRKEIVLHSDVLKALSLKEQEVLASLRAELENKTGADMLNETIVRVIEEPNKLEQATQTERARILGIIKSFDFDKYISIGIDEKGKLDDDDMIFTDEGLKELTSKIKGDKEK